MCKFDPMKSVMAQVSPEDAEICENRLRGDKDWHAWSKVHNPALAGDVDALRQWFQDNRCHQKAYGFFKRQNIVAYMRYRHEQIIAKTETSRDWWIQRQKEIVDRCMQVQPVLDKDGEPTGEYRFDAAGANKALDQLGRYLGVFEKDNEQRNRVELFELHAKIREIWGLGRIGPENHDAASNLKLPLH